MCSPAAAVALTALSGAASVAGQIQQGQVASRQARFQAAVARNNAVEAERRAAEVTEQGAIERAELRRRADRQIARRRAELAARGLLVDQDSPLQLLQDAAEQGALESVRLRRNVAREAAELRARAAAFRNESAFATLRGNAVVSAASIGAAGTLLGTLENISKDLAAPRAKLS